MKRSTAKHSRHQLRCLMTRLRGSDVGDAIEAATHFPLAPHGEHDHPVKVGHFIETQDSSRKSYCDMPDDASF